MTLPLRHGDAGEAVRDLQSRLAGLGFPNAADEPGDFGEATRSAVLAFQKARGLRADGVCGAQTWAAVVEAGYQAGDRLLYYTSPALRGDDVAALQRQLGALGFDSGRVDGIFGERTQRAVLEFQRNAGLPVDAVCGPSTLDAIERLSARTSPEPVAAVRERDALRHSPRTLTGRRVVVGDLGGLDALSQAVSHGLMAWGALAIPLHHPDASAQAAHANGLGVDVYLGLAASAERCLTAYYGAHGFESAGGRHLAERIHDAVGVLLGGELDPPVAMAIPVLRETRMPAVVCELGPPALVVERGGALAAAFCQAFAQWTGALDKV